MSQEKKLKDEIEKTARQERCFGWGNYFAAYFIESLAVAGSIAATILVSLTPQIPALETHKWLVPVVAAIPAGGITIKRIFNFEPRALYHWWKAYKIRGLSRKLEYEGVDEKVVSQEFTEVELETLKEWVRFGVVDREKAG
jgi:hypothetical protein